MITKTEVTKKVLKERDKFLDSYKDMSPKELITKCGEDPALFAYYMLGVKLYGWQWLVTRELVKGEKKIILDTSRQIGKSFLVGICSLWYQLYNKGHSSQFNNTKIGVISATEGQAKKLLLDIKNLMRVGDAHCKIKYNVDRLFTSLIDKKQGSENSKSCITFMSYEPKFGVFLKGSTIGGFIKCLPPTEIVRGETFDFLIVDEASKIDDEIYNSAISKTGDKYDAIRFITSTPYGRSGFYYEMFDPEEKLENNKWVRFWFTVEAIKSDDEIDYKRRIEDIKFQMEAGHGLAVRQEYYGEFVQGEQSFFNPTKIDEMIEDYTPVESYSKECDIGVDFGGLRKSKTVLTISTYDEEEGKIYRLWHHEYDVNEDASVLEDIKELKTRFNIQRVCVDYCPEGHYKVREMEDLGWDVTRMQFASEKVKKYGDFRTMLNRGNIKSYKDSNLMIEMKALAVAKGRERTKIQPPPGYSDDSIDSFVISCYHFTEIEDNFKVWSIDEV